MQFSTKIDGFEQKDSQGFENSYNSYEQYPLEKFLIFTIYQNYTLALSLATLLRVPLCKLLKIRTTMQLCINMKMNYVKSLYVQICALKKICQS